MSTVRQPAVRVRANGAPVAGVIAAEVHSVSHFAADRFSVTLAAAGNIAAWAAGTDTIIEVLLGIDADEISMITGRIDSLTADPIGGTLHIEGRDLSAGLIQTPTHEAFANQTASDIAILLAGRQGLTPVVTATATPVGRYYSADHTRVTLDRLSRASTQWDLLALLAQQEGFDVFVAGTSLYFQPVATDLSPTLVLRPAADGFAPANVSSLRLQRRMTLAGDITVTVKSWNTQQQAAFVETATRAGTGGMACAYAYVRPNLTPADASLLAQRKLNSITRHEVTLDATMPGELTLSPRDTVAVVGTGSVFDTVYVVDDVSRRISAREGFVQSVRAHVTGGLEGA